MATVRDVSGNGRLLTVALSIVGAFFVVIVAMLGFWMDFQAESIAENRRAQTVNGNRLTAIEARLESIENDIGAMR